MAENDIITRGVNVKIQQVSVRGNYDNPTTMPRVKMSKADRNPWLAKMLLMLIIRISLALYKNTFVYQFKFPAIF